MVHARHFLLCPETFIPDKLKELILSSKALGKPNFGRFFLGLFEFEIGGFETEAEARRCWEAAHDKYVKDA
jgi:hypothetical protein